MRFSVLLSVYYKEKPTYLRESLDSIFTQILPPDEVILVKDGPLTDDLEQLIKEYCRKYSKIKVVPLIKNVGLGNALNEGLKLCSFDIVARMDTDDIAKPERFAKQMAIFYTHPEIDVVGAWIDEFENNIKNVVSVRKVPETHEEIQLYAKKRNPVNHPVVMFRKLAVLNAGGYLHFPLLEDYYLWVRMLMNGACFYNIQESLLYFRCSSDMFQRRGGWKYLCTGFRFQLVLLKMGFIDFQRCILNIMIRFIFQIIPNQWRSVLYKKVLRKS